MTGAHRFQATLYYWRDDPTSWVFVDLPPDVADEIDDEAFSSGLHRGFGSIRVRASIGATTWETSLFLSTGHGTFVLPVKKPVRHAEGVDVGDQVTVGVSVLAAG